MSQRYWLGIEEVESGKQVDRMQIFGNNDCFKELQDFAKKYTEVDYDGNFEFELNDKQVNELLDAVDEACVNWLEEEEEKNGKDVIINISEINNLYDHKDRLYSRLFNLDELSYYFTESLALVKFYKACECIEMSGRLTWAIRCGYKVIFGRY